MLQPSHCTYCRCRLVPQVKAALSNVQTLALDREVQACAVEILRQDIVSKDATMGRISAYATSGDSTHVTSRKRPVRNVTTTSSSRLSGASTGRVRSGKVLPEFELQLCHSGGDSTGNEGSGSRAEPAHVVAESDAPPSAASTAAAHTAVTPTAAVAAGEKPSPSTSARVEAQAHPPAQSQAVVDHGSDSGVRGQDDCRLDSDSDGAATTCAVPATSPKHGRGTVTAPAERPQLHACVSGVRVQDSPSPQTLAHCRPREHGHDSDNGAVGHHTSGPSAHGVSTQSVRCHYFLALRRRQDMAIVWRMVDRWHTAEYDMQWDIHQRDHVPDIAHLKFYAGVRTGGGVLLCACGG